MSRRHFSPPLTPQTGAGRGRPPRRTPQDNVRAAAAWVLERTLQSLAPADSFLDSALPRFDERDQGLLRELVMGSLRWLRRIDHVIAAASNRSFQQIETALHATLRVATYQLLFLDRVPAHAAVHEAVEQAHQITHRGGASFVNGVLRRIARAPRLEDWPVEEADPVRRLGIEKSHPDFLVARWLERFGRERAFALLDANNQAKPMHLLAFRDRGGRELLAETLIDEGLEVEPASLSHLGLIVRRGNPFASAAFQRGDFYVQDEASQAAALIPPPRPGETVLDAAAAPGGKSFSLLAREPGVRVTASDVALPRVNVLRSNLRRLRRDLPLAVADAGAPPFAGPFDRVVLDLPCTGTGTLRRHPEIKWRISESEIGRLSSQALRLLDGAAPLVAPGGHLVAITCSLEKEENEDVTARFLATRSGFSLLPLEGLLENPVAASITGPGGWRILTGGDHDGFTVNVLAKARI
ncbi:MAG TPA: transcription antitermination factor NusB [Thermoanaerobaculia bacterium]|jgi:16S rRNA (cytosine967-C5)-methyltransferase|nr:transcription antitermination factor NusB [Thermoanaerobaculia bacterium]